MREASMQRVMDCIQIETGLLPHPIGLHLVFMADPPLGLLLDRSHMTPHLDRLLAISVNL
ncbi:hypothetical protein M5K25_027468 [Dendrobium thyrsiflorum]|uniref:Uncharacterized protein n=1 Tax=Dendrobium thyrsiflorum TaxID=117978 RepID=A0ABD0TTU6_DENTH